jgi:DNA-binding response OmpR family regulator
MAGPRTAGGGPGPVRPRVLVVDDEPAICAAVASALVQAGYDALSALSGEAAHDLLRSRHVDVLVLDLRMPDMRGDVLYYLASALQPHLACATMFLTGDVTAEGRKMIADCGSPLVRKPYDIEVLLDTVAALCPLSLEEIA